MKNTLQKFQKKQTNTIELLKKLEFIILEGKEVGIPIDSSFIKKITNAINCVESEKLKVALIGGFSEGKTAIAAAWMGKIDKRSMKISHQESSNEVKVYEIDDSLLLVDTPGLFGFKEQENPDSHAIEKYKDITKKHVSEAHLILYVMNSVNPIKQSHQDDLTWLFRSLGLLDRTVFVLSQFDEVVDVEDEQAYKKSLIIKQQNVTERLKEIISLNDFELEEISIVAVAANPYDLGVEYWLERPDEFKKLSHISQLQAATTDRVQQNGGSKALIDDMQISVLRDVLYKQIPIAIEIDQSFSKEVVKLEAMHNRLNEQLVNIDNEIELTRIKLRNFVIDYFTGLILQAKGTSLETVSDFFEREIGSEGIVIITNLQNEFSLQIGAISLEVEKMQLSFDNEVGHFNTIFRSLGKQSLDYVLKGNIINNTTVIVARDCVTSIAKSLGFDIAKHLKFKPYGAVNLAKGIKGAFVFLGFALEAWDSYDKYKQEKKFQDAIREMIQNFEGQRKELLTLIGSETFKEQFFNDYLELKNCLTLLKADLDNGRARQKAFHNWRVNAESLSQEVGV